MKHYYNLIIIALVASLYACSEAEQVEQKEERGPEVTGIVATLGEKSTDVSTRNTITGYAVNTKKDPTKTEDDLSDRTTDWLLDLQIYKGEDAYTDGGTITGCTYVDNKWNVLAGSLYFPNYTNQKIALTLRPAAWTVGTTTIATVQNEKKHLLAQDVLKENNSTTTYSPAHIISTITLKHAHSMINFVLKDINTADIGKVAVVIGKITYTPYPVEEKKEYMLILPANTSGNPEIHITTTDGKKYIQTITIIKDGRTEYGENNCYCFTLQGIELKLSPIIIADWVTGEAIDGDYVGVTEYPTFRGPANTSCELYFDNNLIDGSNVEIWQTLTFNSRGECTVKPYGRKIIKIKVKGKDEKVLSPNEVVILGDMIIDLNTVLASIQSNSTRMNIHI